MKDTKQTFLYSILASVALTLFLSLPAGAKVVGNPKAPKGGTFIIGSPAYPKHILFYLGFDEPSNVINSLVMETLLDQDPETYDFIPLLAEKWTMSPDKKTFTFKLNPKARFSDGQPVTANDVKFTWDTLLNVKNKTAPFQAYYSSFESCKVLDPLTVEFKAKTLHFKNLEKLAALVVLPQHIYSKGDFNKAFHETLKGSGPYVLDALKKGERVFLRRDANYWGKELEHNIGRYNFDQVVFKFTPDANVQFELFKKGEIDYLVFYSSKVWTKDAVGPLFDKGYIKKIKGENKLAYGTQGIVWNLRKPLFQDPKVRIALSSLMNREKWIKDLFYDNYIVTAGPVGVNSEYHNPDNKPIKYDPKKANALLDEAGWKVGPDGIRAKDGAKFVFELLVDSPGHERYLTLYQEDLKKAGITMTIRQTDWATGIKLVDDRQFDGTLQNRGREVNPGDFAVVWGSKQADIKGSANTAGYKNAEVDALAVQIDEAFDKKVRVPLVRKLDLIIGNEQPMSFAWESTFFRVAYWDKVSFVGKGYHPYTSDRTAFHYWWFDEAKAKKLLDAQKAGTPLK